MITGIKTSMNQYYYNKEAVSKENEVSFEKKTKKDYKKVVEEYKKKHPQSASNVDEQVQAGKDYIRKCGADDIPRSEMTMEQYKAFIKNLMNGVPFDISQRNDTEQWSITEEGWEQMKNDRDYEAWILGYTKLATTSSTGGLILALIRADCIHALKAGITSIVTGPL